LEEATEAGAVQEEVLAGGNVDRRMILGSRDDRRGTTTITYRPFINKVEEQNVETPAPTDPTIAPPIKVLIPAAATSPLVTCRSVK
jgi:hypothetical protein